ncbi:MAG TPA: hydroxyacylglutathione hydrolase [Burkholderiales bacterium]|nr:hydroxyacylglutathione hydrolase [Burkholderiales bacterium]
MNADLSISPISAFNDNYIWTIHNKTHAVVIDPGDAGPVLAFLQKKGLDLSAILITHHHHDHVDGNADLIQRYPVPVYGPAAEVIPCKSLAVQEGNTIELKELALSLHVMEVPGHTAGHVAYYADGMVFCGDTLFGCGCGRLFEGTPAQMLASLTKLAQLPRGTRVYCAHEYTLGNIAFALTIEPGNPLLHSRAAKDRDRIAHGDPTLPSTIGLELDTNPFLRCELAEIRNHVEILSGRPLETITDVFGALRRLKNEFK